LNINKQQKWFS